MNLSNSKFSILFLSYFLLWVSYTLLSFREGIHRDFIAIYMVAFIPYFFALKSTISGNKPSRPVSNAYLRTSVFIFPIVLIFSNPVFTTDSYRYLWDAYVMDNNINPYLYSPDHLALNSLAEKFPNFSKINHKNSNTIYPPLWQFLNFGLYKIFGSLLGVKIFNSLILVVLSFFSGYLFREDHRSNYWLIGIGWNPIFLIEFCANGHNDLIAIFMLLVGFSFLLRSQFFQGSLFFSLGFMAKLLPILALYLIPKQKIIQAITILFLVTFGLLIPFYQESLPIFSGLKYFSEVLKVNDGIFSLIFYLFNSLWFPIYDEAILGTKILLIGVLVVILYGIKNKNSLEVFTIILTCIFLFSSQIHPWYLAWVLPFWLYFNKKSIHLLALLLPISYITILNYEITGFWEESFLIKLAIYLPFFGLLLFEFREKVHYLVSSKIFIKSVFFTLLLGIMLFFLFYGRLYYLEELSLQNANSLSINGWTKFVTKSRILDLILLPSSLLFSLVSDNFLIPRLLNLLLVMTSFGVLIIRIRSTSFNIGYFLLLISCSNILGLLIVSTPLALLNISGTIIGIYLPKYKNRKYFSYLLLICLVLFSYLILNFNLKESFISIYIIGIYCIYEFLFNNTKIYFNRANRKSTYLLKMGFVTLTGYLFINNFSLEQQSVIYHSNTIKTYIKSLDLDSISHYCPDIIYKVNSSKHTGILNKSSLINFVNSEKPKIICISNSLVKNLEDNKETHRQNINKILNLKYSRIKEFNNFGAKKEKLIIYRKKSKSG